MKKILSLLLCALLLLSFVACESEENDANVITTTTTKKVATTLTTDPYPIAEIVMQNGDVMILQLDANLAPKTVESFVSLVNSGYYNGVSFSLLSNGSILSGETEETSQNIFGEFSANSYSLNTNSHIRGAVSMYRPDELDYNSASNQFFICNQNLTQLDGRYAVFGYVIKGLDVLDNITKNSKSLQHTTIKQINILADDEIKEYADATTTKALQTVGQSPFSAHAGLIPDEYIDAQKVDKNHPLVCITVKNVGKITLQLDATQAPITVANFISLVEDGFYDGLTFHRIIDGFMIQGGDPTGTGMGGSDKEIKGEFSANGVNNTIKHLRGVISMARSTDMDSASSQFFICDADSPHLDGQYAAFGYVVSGMNVVDYIADNAIVQDSNGTVNAADQPIIEKIEVVEK